MLSINLHKSFFLIVLTILLFTVAITAGCSGPNNCDHNPCSISELEARFAKLGFSLPIYIPKKEFADSDIVTKFLFYYDGSEIRLWTLFTSAKTGVQIARLVTSPFEQPLDMMTTRNSVKVHVNGANGTTAAMWELLPGKYRDDSTQGHPYQTFIVWAKGNLWFHFYSTLGLDETLKFINALEEVKD